MIENVTIATAPDTWLRIVRMATVVEVAREGVVEVVVAAAFATTVTRPAISPGSAPTSVTSEEVVVASAEEADVVVVVVAQATATTVEKVVISPGTALTAGDKAAGVMTENATDAENVDTSPGTAQRDRSEVVVAAADVAQWASATSVTRRATSPVTAPARIDHLAPVLRRPADNTGLLRGLYRFQHPGVVIWPALTLNCLLEIGWKVYSASVFLPVM